jgi:hypothetical protein
VVSQSVPVLLSSAVMTWREKKLKERRRTRKAERGNKMAA